MKPAATALAALAIVACSSGTTGGTDNPDAGNPDETTPAYWGLKDDLCLHFKDDQGRERYTVNIEEDDKAVPGKKTWHLEHRFQGIEVQSDWVEVKGEQVVLHRRSLTPIGETSILWRYDPPVVFLEKGMEAGDVQATESTTNRSAAGSTAPENLTFTVAAFGAGPLDVMGQSKDAERFNQTTDHADGSVRTDKLWLVPEIGLVKYDPHGDYDPSPSAEEVFILESVETLAAGAPCVTK